MPYGYPDPPSYYGPPVGSFMPQLPPSQDPYGLAGQMAFSNWMSQRSQSQAGMQAGMSALARMGSPGGGPDPNLARWVGPEVARVQGQQGGDPFFSRIMSQGQDLIDANAGANGGGYLGAMRTDMRNQGIVDQGQQYQAYSDQMQQLAMQQAMDQRTFAEQLAQTMYTDAVQGGMSEAAAQAKVQALMAASGDPSLMGRMGPALQAIYPTGQGMSPFYNEAQSAPLGQAVNAAVLKAFGPQDAQTLTKLGLAANANPQSPGSFMGFSDYQSVHKYALTLLLSDPTTSPLVAQNPALADQLIQQAYQGMNARFAPGGSDALSGVNTAGQAGPLGDVTFADRGVNALANAGKWAAFGAMVGSPIPGVGPLLGGIIGGGGGLLSGLFGAKDTPGDMSPGKALMDIGVRTGTGALQGTVGRLPLVGLEGLPLVGGLASKIPGEGMLANLTRGGLLATEKGGAAAQGVARGLSRLPFIGQYSSLNRTGLWPGTFGPGSMGASAEAGAGAQMPMMALPPGAPVPASAGPTVNPYEGPIPQPPVPPGMLPGIGGTTPSAIPMPPAIERGAYASQGMGNLSNISPAEQAALTREGAASPAPPSAPNVASIAAMEQEMATEGYKLAGMGPNGHMIFGRQVEGNPYGVVDWVEVDPATGTVVNAGQSNIGR